MNTAQIKAAQRLTRRIDNACKYYSREGWRNGPVTYTVEPVAGAYMLSASNANNEKRWFETFTQVIVFIGPRGGLTISHCEGVSRTLIN